MRFARRRSLLALTTVLVFTGMLSVIDTPVSEAANTIAFTSRFTTNANGAVLSIGNNLLTCSAGSSSGGVSCANARNGSVADNNGFAMVNLDADGDASTFNSSSSALNLPVGSTVLWAGLYWGARLQAGAGGSAGDAGSIDTMRLQAPGGAYQTITASTAARDQFGPNRNSYNAYQRFADVTSIVQAAGNGTYWGANVTAATGQDRYAGWALTVVYTAPGLPLRNLTVFDGFNAVSGGNPQNITVSGFQAPLAGTVDAQLTMVAYEGDLSQTGDFTRLNSTQLATALSPGSNFFDSANGLSGALVTTRTPADRNQLGFDIKNLGVSGAIPNGATSARFTFSSNGDIYYPGVVGMAINLYAPDFTFSSKTVVNLSGNSPARPGDTLQYTLNYVNTGQDPAVEVVSTDVLPANTTYVPGSLALVNPLTGATTPVSDGAGDDPGEYEAASRTVRVRLGAGATAGAGGTLQVPGANPLQHRASYTFRVTLDAAAGGSTVTNIANLAYRTGTTDIAATYPTNPASVDVVSQANLSITKEMSPDPSAIGSTTTGTITITNNGPDTAMNVTMRDPLTDGWTNDSISTPDGGSCSVTGGTINCDFGNVPNGQSRRVIVTGRMDPGTTQPTLTNVAYVGTNSYDPDQTDNVATDTVALNRVADLAITKTASPAMAAPGVAVSYTLSVTNTSGSNAQDVVITDAVADQNQLRLTAVTGTTGGATCPTPQPGSLRCTVASLAAGATATVTVTGVLTSSLAPGTTVANTATVTASTADSDSANNSATATVTVGAGSADLRMTKSVAPTTVVAGSPVTYTLTATNFGPSDALETTITDDLPEGITATSVQTSRGTCTIQADTPSAGRQRVRCTVTGLASAGTGTAAPGAEVQVTIDGTVDSAAAGSLANTAEVASVTSDPDLGNNAATATMEVTRSFDLGVTKRANRSSLPAAAPDDTRPITYTITITNNGPSVATGVVVNDLIPTNDEDPETALEFLAATPGSGSCAAPADIPGDPEHRLLTCTLADPIPVGDSQTVVVEMLAASDLADLGDDLTETVTIEAPGETNPANNTTTWTLRGDPQSDLELLKTAPATVTAGSMVTYHFEVTNHPPNPEDEELIALAPTLEDTLPDGVTLVPAGDAGSVTPAYCEASGQDVTCAMPDNIPPNTTATVEFSVLIDPGVEGGTTLVNTAEVVNDPSNPDPAPDNNVAQATSTVVADADVTVSGMSIVPDAPDLQGPNTWREITFTLTNNGPSTARAVVFNTHADTPSTSVDPTGLPEDCDIVQRELICTIDGEDLAPGESVEISFRVVLAGDLDAGDYLGYASVSSSTPDSDLSNNETQAPFEVTEPRTDLRISKTAVDTVGNPNGDGHSAYFAGRPYAFQIVVEVPNEIGNGVADARDVMLTDPMPEGFTATLVSTTKGTCGVVDDGAGVSCDLGTIAAWPGSSEPVTVTVFGLVDVDAEGSSSPTPPPRPRRPRTTTAIPPRSRRPRRSTWSSRQTCGCSRRPTRRPSPPAARWATRSPW